MRLRKIIILLFFMLTVLYSGSYYNSNISNPEDEFKQVINFINKSPLIARLHFEDTTIRQHHLSRADGTIILNEFLKLKNSNFKLPYDIEFYENPFADIDDNKEYFDAVITLANYKGSDSVTVLTKEHNEFKPLQAISRFEFVKMIVEGLNIPKSSNFSNIEKFDDYNQLAQDAKVYYSTAVREGIIKGDNNKLLPYDKLTIYQALVMLNRTLNRQFNVDSNYFSKPTLSKINVRGKSLGIIPDNQYYDSDVSLFKINSLLIKNDNRCLKLIINSNINQKAQGKDFYKWIVNFGYLKKISKNNKEVLFCPSTKKPNTNFKIKVIGTDRYMHFDEYNIEIDRNKFNYDKNIADTYPNEVKQSINLQPMSSILKENDYFNIKISGNVYKDKLKIGLEKVAITLIGGGKIYSVNDAQVNGDTIAFLVPSVKEFYGKTLQVKVDYVTNAKAGSQTFNLAYKPNFVINGEVAQDKNGNYPKYVTINGKQISVENGKFLYVAQNVGNYIVKVNRNYPTQTVNLNNENPTSTLYLYYIDLDYDNDGVENDKDKFPYDPAISVDSDGDGFPDKYNSGYTSASLPLDKYPYNSEKWLSDNNQIPNLSTASIQYTVQYLKNNQFKLNWDIKNAKAMRFEYSFDGADWKEFDLVNLLATSKTESIKTIDEAKNHNKIYFRANVKDKNNRHIYKEKTLAYTPDIYVQFATEKPASTTLRARQNGQEKSAELWWRKIIDSHYKLNVKEYEIKWTNLNSGEVITSKVSDNSDPNNMYSSNHRIINGLQEAPYEFMVRGCNDLGCGEWSNSVRVNIKIPHEPMFKGYIYPSEGAKRVEKQVTFKWDVDEKGNKDVYYKIYWGEDKNNLIHSNHGWIKSNNYEVEKPLKPNTKYYWQVVMQGDDGKNIKSPIHSFTTERVGYNLAILDIKPLNEIKPDSSVTFRVKVVNTGDEKAPNTFIVPYYKKNGKVYPFRYGMKRIGKELAYKEEATVDITVKFLPYVIHQKTYTGEEIVYDNVLVTGDSKVIMDMPLLKNDGGDLNEADNKLDCIITYKNAGAPKFEYIGLRNGALVKTFDETDEFYGITNKDIKIVAQISDDVKVDHVKMVYKAYGEQNWHLIKDFKNTNTNNPKVMIFDWTDKNGEKVHSQYYDWSVPKELANKEIQIKLIAYDDQNMVSVKMSSPFHIYSDKLDVSNVTLDKSEYKVGDVAFLTMNVDSDNDIVKLKGTLEQENNNKSITVLDLYDANGLNLNSIIKIKLPNNNYYTSDKAYLKVTLTDKYHNIKSIKSKVFKFIADYKLPSYFGKLVELYKTLNHTFPTNKDITSKQSSNKIVGIKIDDKNIVHAVIESSANYNYKERDGGSYHYYSGANVKYIYITYDSINKKVLNSIKILETNRDSKEQSGLYLSDFILKEDIPIILFNEKRFNSNSKYYVAYKENNNFIVHEILNSDKVKWNDIKLFVFKNKVYANWVDSSLGSKVEDRRNKVMGVYPDIGSIQTIADFYLGKHLHFVDNKYLYASCGKFYSIKDNLKVDKLIKKYNFSCGLEGEYKKYTDSNFIYSIPFYDSNEHKNKIALIKKDFSTEILNSDISDVKVSIYNGSIIYDGYKSGKNIIGIATKEKKYEIQSGNIVSTSSNHLLVDMNKNKQVVLATFGKTLISIGDLSKDFIDPIVYFTTIKNIYKVGNSIDLKWFATDNSKITKIGLYKVENGQNLLLKEFNSASGEYRYTLNEKGIKIFKVVAFDDSGNSSYDKIAINVVEPVNFSSFNMDKKNINLGDSVKFSWQSNGDSHTKYTLYLKEIHSNIWKKIAEVKGVNSYEFKPFNSVGTYEVKIVANNDTEKVLEEKLNINAELVVFYNDRFTPKGKYYLDSKAIPLGWEDSAKMPLAYDIWVKGKNDSSYKKVASTQESSYNYVITKVEPFSWKVGTQVNGVYVESDPISVEPISSIATPELKKVEFVVSKDSDDIYNNIEYTTSADANGYLIYRDECNGAFSLIGNSQTNSYKDYSIEYGKCYSYKIAIIAENGVISKFSNDKNVTTILNENYNVIIENKNNLQLSGNSITLKFKPNKSVSYENYLVMLGTNPNELYNYTITKNREVRIANLNYATTYYVAIYPLDPIGNRLSSVPAKLTFTTGFDKRKIEGDIKVSIDEVAKDHISISWNEVKNADYYQIWRSENGGEYELLTTSYDNAFVDFINIEYDKKYHYIVKAVNSNESKISTVSNEITIPKDSEPSNNFINIKKLEWNLISASLDTDMITNPDIDYAWSYKDGKWYGFSQDSYIMQKIIDKGIKELHDLNETQGVWIKASDDLKFELKNNENMSYSLVDGWNLLGTNKDINTTYFNNTCAKYIWKYETQKPYWKLHIFDESIKTNYQYRFDKIEKGKGFWLRCKKK